MQITTTPGTVDVLAKAIDKRTAALVSLELEGKRYKFPVTLLDLHVAPFEEDGIWVEVSGTGKYVVDQLIQSGATVDVTFRNAESSVHFQTVIFKKKRHFWLNKTVLLSCPRDVRVVEHRANNRAPVPEEIEVTARVALAKEISEALVGKVADLSRGGASLIVPAERAKALLAGDKPVRLELDFNGESVSVDAEVRSARPFSAGAVRLGLQFINQGGAADASDETYLRRLADFEERHVRNALLDQLKNR